MRPFSGAKLDHMDIQELATAKILPPEATAELKRLRIATVEAFLARTEDPKTQENLSERLKVTRESLAQCRERAQKLVPKFNPAESFGPVSRGAWKPPGV